ncbi:hypothetical protein BDE02_14G107400 [Populus trichocarpa]|nr:hypothetical protein BDE02_14G107400 [Populus trichocarpa]
MILEDQFLSISAIQGFTGTACYVCSWANYLHDLQKLKLGSRSDSDFKTAFSFLHLLSQ